jgi:hypothetical protein
MGGGVIRLVYTWLDPQRKSYGLGYGSSLVPGWTRPCSNGGRRHHHPSSAGSLRLGGVALITLSTTSGVILAIGLSWPWPKLYTHNRHSPAAPGILEVTRGHHFSTLCDWNWGPQLQITAMPYAWPRSGDNERSLVAAWWWWCSPLGGGPVGDDGVWQLLSSSSIDYKHCDLSFTFGLYYSIT